MSISSSSTAASVGLFWLLLVGCDTSRCIRNRECARGLSCVEARCVASADGGPQGPVTDPLAGSGAEADAGSEEEGEAP